MEMRSGGPGWCDASDTDSSTLPAAVAAMVPRCFSASPSPTGPNVIDTLLMCLLSPSLWPPTCLTNCHLSRLLTSSPLLMKTSYTAGTQLWYYMEAGSTLTSVMWCVREDGLPVTNGEPFSECQ